MPISRNPRLDRRRRVLLDGGTAPEVDDSNDSRRRQKDDKDSLGSAPRKRSAGYSQEVRRACGQRLVQLIPTRRRSYLAAILVSLLIPAVLLTGHYMIYVSGSLPWYGQPLAVALDASHYRSIAAWFSSHLWLLCLGATILTFQLRRHKLDDYDGEYRLWFWLVLTCLAASIDATTHITELLGLALNRWSQIQLGWSGPAVVQATLTALIGMLGLRLCTELKTVPASLAFWLIGLVAWAGSAVLAQEMVKVDISLQLRIWLRVTLWMSGLTCVWLSALTYLRSVYIEAQQRFLPRGRMAARINAPLGQRIRESIPTMPAWRSHADAEEDAAGETKESKWKLPSFRRQASVGNSASDEHSDRKRDESPPVRPDAPVASQTTIKSQSQPKVDAPPSSKPSPLSFFKRSRDPNQAATSQENNKLADSENRRESSPNSTTDGAPTSEKSRLTGWLRKPKNNDEADEFKKVTKSIPAATAKSSPAEDRADSDDDSPTTRKSWLPKMSLPKLPSIPKPSLSRLVPKIKLPSFRLPPPNEVERSSKGQSSRNSSADGLPTSDDEDKAGGESGPSNPQRAMSKAERRRLRRMQNQDRAA